MMVVVVLGDILCLCFTVVAMCFLASNLIYFDFLNYAINKIYEGTLYIIFVCNKKIGRK